MSEEIIKTASAAQILAAQPDISSWVSANAGSGKTRVLTNRVSRLLLRGTDPAKILCLTFTTAAAAEMQNRLFKQLGEWAMLPDEALQNALQQLGEIAPTGADLTAARTLFARALETPGGLKIQTIHAFCESLLHRFPLEARISPDFEVMDDRQTVDLRNDVLNELAVSHQDIFDTLVMVHPKDPLELLPEILKHQERFEKPFDTAKMAGLLNANPDLTPEIILGQVMFGLPDADIRSLANTMIKVANKRELTVANALGNVGKIAAEKALILLEAAFLTKGKPRATGRFPVKAVKEAFPPAFDLVIILIERVARARENRLALKSLQKTAALHAFAQVFLQAYGARKADLGRLEFEDLIRKTEGLLRNSDMAQWVLYRLDGGIDHILVDEAQDTSPLQWQIVSALAEEIYATADQNRPRTVFVVGDEKQSIFSFQGADPQEFARMRALFDQQLDARGEVLAQGELLHSFRSAGPILQLVDAVFQNEMAEGLSGTISHLATDNSRPGRVEIWPFLEAPEKPEQKKWFEPIDSLPPGDAKIVLAEKVAERVAELISSRHELPGENRPVRARDFLILVQSRGAIFHGIIKALKSRSVPVAGADRLKIAEELAVKDLLACLHFAASPHDDLALACALRSPLCGVSEAELFKLAHGRKSTLWPEVKNQEMLIDILSRADFERPYELLERILIKHSGRKNLLARLGPEAMDGIDELLRLALDFESTANPSLTGFLEWISADDIEIKRRMDDATDQVRVMTVHGAKGLEAPIVILPQTVKRPNNTAPTVVPLEDVAVMSGTADTMPEILNMLNESRKKLLNEEKNRLLYVALTRAKNWLMIAGVGDRKSAKNNWYDTVYGAAEKLGAERDDAGRLIFQAHWSAEKSDAVLDMLSQDSLPEWLEQSVIPPSKPIRPRAPSNLGGGHTIVGAVEDSEALLRGTQIHLLLEKLAQTAPDIRVAQAEELLEGMALNGVIPEAISVLSASHLQQVFAPETLHEVAISADIPGLGPIYGRIDALIVGEDITAIDFKSNAKIPKNPSEIPESFLRQMGAYRAALTQIWPGRMIKTAICWTHNAELMEIPENLCIAALLRAAEP